MLQTLRNAWSVPELRRKLMFTVLVLFLYRLGCWIPVPGVDITAMQDLVGKSDFLGFLNTISGGSLANFTFLSLGISPYITASIVMQLLTVAIPALERLSKEDGGRKKINMITRYVTIGLAIVEALGFIATMQGANIAKSMGVFEIIMVTVTITAGSTLVMWMGEQITQKGIGNGISLLIFMGIVARFPALISQIITVWAKFQWMYVIIAAAVLLLIGAITFVDLGQRRVPVQYAKQQKGRKLYGGQTTHIPMKVNATGVLPLIFAMSFVSFPKLIAGFFPGSWFADKFVGTLYIMPVYIPIYLLLIVGFTYFYVSISVNTEEISKNLQQYGGFVQGIRPGKPTTDFLKRINRRLTFFGAIFLAAVAVIPLLFNGTEMGGIAQLFSASSILIMVSVALETSKQLESQMLMRNYKGFLS